MKYERGPVVELVAPYLDRLKPSGPGWVMARCPFHNDRTPSFAIHGETGGWVCHACGLRGGLADFLRGVGMNRSSIDALIEPLREDLQRHQERLQQEARYRFRVGNPFLAKTVLPESVLGLYDYKPMGLVRSGFDPKLLRRLDIGYDQRKQRITFPIRDVYGNLVGVSGRATRKGDEPRYKVYRGGQKIDGQWRPGDFGEMFDQSHPGFQVESRDYLWNAHRVYPALARSRSARQRTVFVVEGYKACIWLVQHGLLNVVALMGSSMTKTQADLLRRMSGNIALFLDNDEPGRRATRRIGKWLSRSLEVTICAMDEEHQPDDLNIKRLRQVVANRRMFQQWERMKTHSKA